MSYIDQSTNHYQIKKTIQFLDNLPNNSLIKFFSDTRYRSLVTIPEVVLDKGLDNCWVAEVWIAEELFYYAHPFLFPKLLNRKLTKHQFDITFYFVQRFSSVDVEKIFFIEDFLNQYASTLSNQKKTDMKRYFIELVQSLEKNNLIESKYKVFNNGKFYDTNQLNTNSIPKV